MSSLPVKTRLRVGWTTRHRYEPDRVQTSEDQPLSLDEMRRLGGEERTHDIVGMSLERSDLLVGIVVEDSDLEVVRA
jgi:hypothetical protein